MQQAQPPLSSSPSSVLLSLFFPSFFLFLPGRATRFGTLCHRWCASGRGAGRGGKKKKRWIGVGSGQPEDVGSSPSSSAPFLRSVRFVACDATRATGRADHQLFVAPSPAKAFSSCTCASSPTSAPEDSVLQLDALSKYTIALSTKLSTRWGGTFLLTPFSSSHSTDLLLFLPFSHRSLPFHVPPLRR